MNRFFLVLKGISEGIFTGVVFVFIPLILITILSSKSSMLGGLQSFTVLTGSMSPIITTGSVVYTLPAPDPNIGDIITFKRGSINVTHRVVGKEMMNGEMVYKTKGDANKSADNELVKKSQIIGSVLFHFPELGKFASFIRSIPGFLALIVLPTMMFIGFELWNIKTEIEKEAEKRTLKRLGIE